MLAGGTAMRSVFAAQINGDLVRPKVPEEPSYSFPLMPHGFRNAAALLLFAVRLPDTLDCCRIRAPYIPPDYVYCFSFRILGIECFKTITPSLAVFPPGDNVSTVEATDAVIRQRPSTKDLRGY